MRSRNSNNVTTQILRLGALAGVIRSGIMNLVIIASSSGNPLMIVFAFVLSTFGLAFAVALEMCRLALGDSMHFTQAFDLQAKTCQSLTPFSLELMQPVRHCY